jgi:hypothetical protein
LLQDDCLRFADREARDPLELLRLVLLRLLQLLLEGFRVHLAIGETLLSACELDHAAIRLGLLAADSLLRGGDRGPALLDVALDLGAEPDRLLARLDLGLPAHRIGLAARLGEEELPSSSGGRQPTAPEPKDGQCDQTPSDEQPDRDSDADGHVRAPVTLCGCRGVATGPPHTRPKIGHRRIGLQAEPAGSETRRLYARLGFGWSLCLRVMKGSIALSSRSGTDSKMLRCRQNGG